MSLITQCPACATLFKVVPDQLRISEGWVRCGQCDEVFDANAQMVDEAQAFSSSPPAEIERERLEEDDSAVDAGVPDQEPDQEPVLEPEQEPAPDMESPLVVEALEAPRQTEDAVDGSAGGPGTRIEPRLDHLVADPPISFVPLRDPSKTPSRFSSSAVWVVLVGLLLSTLALQWLVKDRDKLAAMDIGLQPVLHAVCGVLGCQVGHVRQIDAIEIESSSFVKVRNDTFRLNFVLKSSGQVPLAMPAMELTLTDGQDQPVMRKVILASEFGVESGVLSPGSDAAVSIPLSVKTASSSERVAGYRLLAFYP